MELFFTENGFETKLEEKPDGYKIRAASQKVLDVQLKIDVEVLGHPNDFTVDYTAEESARGHLSSSVVKSLAWIFGGGIFVLKEEKVKEALEKFEGTFWDFVDEKVAELTRP